MKNLVRKCCLRLTALVLLFAVLSSGFSFMAFAEGTEVYAVVNATSVRVRSGPGTNYDALKDDGGSFIYLNIGHRLTVLSDPLPSEDGGKEPWYEVSFTYQNKEYRGYFRSDYMTLIQTSTDPSDEDFETSIAAFPEDYKVYLRTLHEQHPAWRFELLDTGLDWSVVQDNENVLGRSLVNSSILSYRSTAPGSYSWDTDTYFPLEAGIFYQAAPALVAYYMDPRNFLNEKDIFQFEKLSYDPVMQTEDGARAMLAGSFMENATIKDLDGNDSNYVNAFMQSAQNANVSLYHLIARCIQEVGRSGNAAGTSGTVSGYEGYYNFFSVGANTGAIAGLKYAMQTNAADFRPWDTQYKSIMGGGVFIGSNYINRGQDTLYLQKFCVVGNSLYYHQYMTNISGAYSEALIMRNGYADLGLLDTAFTFKIPVYRNMPEAICAAPAPAGSPNNWLEDLSVVGFALTPTFEPQTTEYSLILNGNFSAVTVSAPAISATALVSGDVGTVSLQTGDNDLFITCTSASGSPKTYHIKLVLNGQGSSGGGGEEPPIPSGWNPTFQMKGDFIHGIAPGTDANAFLSSLGVYGNAYALLTDENENAVSGAIRTGWKLIYFNGVTTSEYKIVIYGDVNQDSTVDIVDLVAIRKYLLGLLSLDPASLEAADINHDEAVDIVDLVAERKALLGLLTVPQ